MEIIKEMIKQFYPLMIAVSCVLFVVGIFFSAEIYDESGIFKGVGNLFVQVADVREIKNDGMSFVEDCTNSYIPLIKYNGGARSSGEIMKFKELLQVRREDGSWVSGSLEDDFTIYLLDIRNQSGKSAMITRTTDEIARMEEIPAPFVYEKEQDMLCCFGIGIYTVIIKVYGANGGMTTYEFKLPVESS